MQASAKRKQDCGRALPPQDRGAPRQSSPKTAQQQQVTGFDPAFLNRLVQGQGHAAGGGVAIAFQVVEDARAGDVQDVDGRIDDADVGLVRDVQVDVFRLQAAVLEDIL